MRAPICVPIRSTASAVAGCLDVLEPPGGAACLHSPAQPHVSQGSACLADRRHVTDSPGECPLPCKAACEERQQICAGVLSPVMSDSVPVVPAWSRTSPTPPRHPLPVPDVGQASGGPSCTHRQSSGSSSSWPTAPGRLQGSTERRCGMGCGLPAGRADRPGRCCLYLGEACQGQITTWGPAGSWA